MKDFGITTGLQFTKSEVVKINTAPSGGKVGAYAFSAAAFQDKMPMCAVRFIPFEQYSEKDVMTLAQSLSASITLRAWNKKGDLEDIVTDLPLNRIAESNPTGRGMTRNMIFAPRFLDWRECFVSLYVPLNVIVPIEIFYP